ncbi:MAG: hypothetical protein ACWA6X_05775 [Bauldia sp.]
MTITEQGISREILADIPGAAAEGAAIAGVRSDASALDIVTAVDSFVFEAQTKPPATRDDWTDRALPLGSLWGQQLVRQFGWEWSMVTLDHPAKKVMAGVFSPNRSLAIYPFDFVFRCLRDGVPVTILLAFNMLVGGSIPALAPRGFENLMEGVHHIVPRR